MNAARRSIVSLLMLVLTCSACSAPQPTGAPADPLVNRVWKVAQHSDAAPGSFYLFLSDGTLLMTSCVETYRLARWTPASAGRLAIEEDPSVRYEASVAPRGDRALTLTLYLKNERVERQLEAVDAPWVCPDLPR